MKQLIHEFTAMSIPNFSFITNPYSIILAIPTTAIAVNVVDLWSAVNILFILFLGDLFTGILASYFDWKKKSINDKWFFGKGEGFSSDEFKKAFVKLIIYFGAPLVVQKFQMIFMIKNFRYESISNGEIGIATFLILIFCLNEGYSIFHENLPRCGFNLFGIIKNLIGVYKDTKKEIEK